VKYFKKKKTLTAAGEKLKSGLARAERLSLSTKLKIPGPSVAIAMAKNSSQKKRRGK
jgi:hypothetical protein